MAAENNGEKNNVNCNDSNDNNAPTTGLEGFIAHQIKEQEKESKEEDNLDVQKREDFISRALAESKWMNKEIQKSQEKRDKLHTEFGAARLDDWRNEHAAEVLTPQQQELVNQHHL